MEIIAQPCLKPGVLGPLPISVGEIFDVVEAAVCAALQEDELPVIEPDFNGQFFRKTFRAIVSSGQGILRLKPERRQASLNGVHNQRYLLVFFLSS